MWFCSSPEVKFHVFGRLKHGEEKSLSKKFFAFLIKTLYRFYQANKKVSVIYTLSLMYILPKSAKWRAPKRGTKKLNQRCFFVVSFPEKILPLSRETVDSQLDCMKERRKSVPFAKCSFAWIALRKITKLSKLWKLRLKDREKNWSNSQRK